VISTGKVLILGGGGGGGDGLKEGYEKKNLQSNRLAQAGSQKPNGLCCGWQEPERFLKIEI